MSKRFNLVSNINNGAGLQKDYELLRGLLESYGHRVNGVQFNMPHLTAPAADINIFLELLAPHVLNNARENWLIPNSEWWEVKFWDRFLPRISKVLCKTKDCFDIWQKKLPGRCVYTGFLSNDFYRPEITRLPVFLHLAGKSETKNTKAVTDAWRTYRLPYPLLVSAFKPCIVAMCEGYSKRYACGERFSAEDTIHKMNECSFHIMPSKYEGFGHALHEAIGCGGVVITTDAPPMNAFNGVDSSLLIPPCQRIPTRAALFNLVDPSHIAETVTRAAQLSTERLDQISCTARAAFLSDREFFLRDFQESSGLMAEKFNGKKAALSITFDDGLTCQHKYAVPEMDKRDVRGTFFICGKHAGRDLVSWRAVAKRHEIGSHSFSHLKATGMTAAELLVDSKKTKEVLETAFGVRVVSHAWPYAITSEDAKVPVRTVFKQARGGHDSPGALFISGPQQLIPFDVRAFNTCGGNVCGVKAMLETAITTESWLTLMLHGVGPDDKEFDNIQTEHFIRMLDAVKEKQKDLWVAPFGVVAARLRGEGY